MTYASELTGKVAIVTGGSSGIGESISRLLAARGASVVVADIDVTRAESVAADIRGSGATATAFRADVSVAGDAGSLTDFAVSTYGGLHLAVNNAGIGGPLGPLTEIDVEGWHRVIDVNLNGVFYGLRAQIPAIIASGGGAIVNVSSIMGLVADANIVPYVAAKHAVAGLTKAAALGYAQQGVRVNSVHPGYIETPLLDELPEEALAGLVALHPIGRLGTSQEVAELVAFLLSDRASFTTGAQYVADGGYTAR